jgi:hypothetical protein
MVLIKRDKSRTGCREYRRRAMKMNERKLTREERGRNTKIKRRKKVKLLS